MHALKLNILIPLYNDWESVNLLLKKMGKVLDNTLLVNLNIYIIDDGSTLNYSALPDNLVNSVQIIRLFRNVGHQKAIALGLSYLAMENNEFPTIVMDSDGEDRPEDIPILLNKFLDNQDKIIFAHRSKRQESMLFKIFYKLYKIVFYFLTGKVITFGNFSLIPFKQLSNLTHVSEIWNNYPGGVIRSKLLYTEVPLERGQRLAGESKMNFVSLILHGLSAVSVFIDTVAVRFTMFCVFMITASVIGIGCIFFLDLFTHIVIPSWASYLVASLVIILFQAFLISLLLVFIVLSYRTKPQFIPAKHFQDFIQSVEVVKTVQLSYVYDNH